MNQTLTSPTTACSVPPLKSRTRKRQRKASEAGTKEKNETGDEFPCFVSRLEHFALGKLLKGSVLEFVPSLWSRAYLFTRFVATQPPCFPARTRIQPSVCSAIATLRVSTSFRSKRCLERAQLSDEKEPRDEKRLHARSLAVITRHSGC